MNELLNIATSPISIEKEIRQTSEVENYFPQEEIEFATSKSENETTVGDNSLTSPVDIDRTKVYRLPKRFVKQSVSLAQKQRILRSWEGSIKEFRDGRFEAYLTDMLGIHEDEIVEIDIQEVDPADRCLVRIGAIFYFTIFQNIKPSGTIQTASEIRFKRSAMLESNAASEIATEAESLFEFFKD